MAFQIVELTVGCDHMLIERNVLPDRYVKYKDAVEAIERLLAASASSGYEAIGDFWWATTEEGKTSVRFIVESV